MNATIQIAEVLKVSPNQIKSVREMAWVYCVVVFGQRATFVSKKKVEAVKVGKTRWDIAVAVAQLINGKPWTGGDKVRVYKGKGFVEVGCSYLNFSSLKNSHNEYSAARAAGLLEYSTKTGAGAQVTAVRRRTTCLNCDMTASVLLGRGYCTDCDGEC